MDIRFVVSPVARLVSYTVDGAVSEDQAGAFLAAVLAHRRFRRGFDFFGEGRGAGEPDVAYPQALARAVRSRAAELGPCRWAVVVCSAHGVGAVRRWAELVPADGVEVAPFLTRSGAIDWLSDSALLAPCHDHTPEGR